MGNDTGIFLVDFGHIGNYGEIDGRVVVVDYGLSKKVYDTHYSPKKQYAHQT
jgi:hypothetical protein